MRHLLAARLRAFIDRVPRRNDQFLLSFRLQCLRDVERKIVVAAAMLAELLAVEPNGRFPVHRAEMQQHAIVPILVDGERAAIPQLVWLIDAHHHAGQRRFDRIRHEDFAVELRGLLFAFGPHGIIPQAVEILPPLPHHLRPRIFRQRMLRRHILRPPRRQWPLGHLPIGGDRELKKRLQEPTKDD